MLGRVVGWADWGRTTPAGEDQRSCRVRAGRRGGGRKLSGGWIRNVVWGFLGYDKGYSLGFRVWGYDEACRLEFRASG